ncbi:hypothetical protein VNO80_02416 [Phaseolus coccineus]|uniref:Uncharacterized protein n=1 Tax=Phaseolus coccineus TaxID=3886 RepID=A0AAN9NPX8_PHACN
MNCNYLIWIQKLAVLCGSIFIPPNKPFADAHMEFPINTLAHTDFSNPVHNDSTNFSYCVADHAFTDIYTKFVDHKTANVCTNFVQSKDNALTSFVKPLIEKYVAATCADFSDKDDAQADALGISTVKTALLQQLLPAASSFCHTN